MAFVWCVSIIVFLTAAFLPGWVYADHDARQKLGIWIYIAISVVLALVLVGIMIVSMRRRPENPHTGLPSGIRKKRRRR